MTAPIRNLGTSGTRLVSQVGALARFSLYTFLSVFLLTPSARRVVRRVFLTQVWFTAVQAVPLIFMLAAILSSLVISQAIRELGRINATELIGTLMVVVIVRELGPLLAALIIAGRSGTAMAAELATNRAMGEVDALEGMGIDPTSYLVVPRVAAAIVSVFGVVVVFDVVAIIAGLFAAVVNGMSSARYFNIVLESLALADVWLTLAKGLVFGAILGILPTYHGLRTRGATTEVPIAARRAVVGSIVAIFVFSAFFVTFSL